MSYATIEDLRSQLGAAKPDETAAYAKKMLHPIPQADTVERERFVLERCAGKHVLEFGASGPLHEGVGQVAASLVGVDLNPDTPSDVLIAFDLDDVSCAELPKTHSTPPDLILCGEVLEHLSNPGWFLRRLKRQYPAVPVLITVPNAFTSVARKHALNGQENVNKDHVCWYSPKTLSVLLERFGYSIAEFYFYGGAGPTAQGIVVVTGA